MTKKACCWWISVFVKGKIRADKNCWSILDFVKRMTKVERYYTDRFLPSLMIRRDRGHKCRKKKLVKLQIPNKMSNKVKQHTSGTKVDFFCLLYSFIVAHCLFFTSFVSSTVKENTNKRHKPPAGKAISIPSAPGSQKSPGAITR